jgi:hypothetical protein
VSQELNGTTGQLVYAIPASGGTNPGGVAWTALLVAKILVAADNTWLSLMEVEAIGGGIEAGFGRQASGGLMDWYNQNASFDINHAIGDADLWALYGVSHAAGNVVARGHRCLLGSVSNSHQPSSSARPDPTSTASGNLRIGGNDDFANMRVAVGAFWVGTALADADFDSIASTKTTAFINTLAPTWLVDSSDDLATDLTAGTQDRTSAAGNTHSSDDPAGWVFGLGGAAAASSFVPNKRLLDRRVRR